MSTLANPLGLLALLGIPAVLAIHFLQRKAIELPVSTLFLLERTQRDAASGRSGSSRRSRCGCSCWPCCCSRGF